MLNRRVLSLLVLGAFLTIVCCATNAIAGKGGGQQSQQEQLLLQAQLANQMKAKQTSNTNPNSQ